MEHLWIGMENVFCERSHGVSGERFVGIPSCIEGKYTSPVAAMLELLVRHEFAPLYFAKYSE